MKLLLVNTPINVRDTLGNFSSIYDTLKMVPSGLSYLAAVARENGIDVRILDQYAESLSMDRVVERIRDFSPDLIGYSSTTPNFYSAISLIRDVRQQFPDILTVMGGQHASFFPEKTVADEAVDFAIRDEGEYPLVALCKAIEKGDGDYSGISGLSFTGPSGPVHNPKIDSIDVDSLPFPAYDLLPMHLYSSPSYTKFAMPCFQMVASRGCPFRCTYCINAELDIAARYRKRNVDSILDEIEMLIHDFGAKQIQFWDPIFPLGQKHAHEFCGKLIARGLHKKIVWNCTTRAETLNEEVIKLMYKAGCRGVGFGIESGVPELLEMVNKKTNLDKVREVCKIARKTGLVVAGAFILGFPDETPEMTRQTIDFAKSLDIHYAQFSIMVPYPGTPLYEQLKAKGEVRAPEEQDFIRFNQSIGLTDVEPLFVPKGRTSADLANWQKKAYPEFYFRPIMVWRHLPHLHISTISGMVRSFAAVLIVAVKRHLEVFAKLTKRQTVVDFQKGDS